MTRPSRSRKRYTPGSVGISHGRGRYVDGSATGQPYDRWPTPPTRGAGARAQVTVMPSEPTDTDLASSGLVAGPFFTAPVAASNWLPWHGQVMTPSSTV